MKTFAFAMLTLCLISALPVEANAVTCARGVHRAGCVGPRGAVATTTHRAVVAPHCYYHRGVRVCR